MAASSIQGYSREDTPAFRGPIQQHLQLCQGGWRSGELSPCFETSSGVRQGCVVAFELLLEPMDWITNRAAHKGFLGVTVGKEICSDLDYADDVSC